MRRETTVSLVLPDGTQRVGVTREEFVRLIRPSVRLAVAALRRTIASAEIDESTVTSVVLTGGAARIPLVAAEFSELGRPVRTMHHPKLTVALGAAHAARARAESDQRSADALATVTPSTNSAAESDDADRLRLWPLSRRSASVLGAAAVVVGALATAIIVPPFTASPEAHPAETTPDPQSESSPSPELEPASPPPDPDAEPETVVPVFSDGDTAAGMNWYIAAAGTANDWGVADFRTGFAQMPGISLRTTNGDMHATWSSTDSLSQFYAQLQDETVDLTELAAADGALVFDFTLLSGAASVAQIAAHCTFPCAGTVDITAVVGTLEPNETTQMVIPAACFADSGLDAKNVNTPFLMIAQGTVDVRVGDIRWESESGNSPDALTC